MADTFRSDRDPDWLAVSLTEVQPMTRFMTLVVCLVPASTGLGSANRRITARTIVTGTGISVPAAGRRFVDALEKNAPRNASQKATNQ